MIDADGTLVVTNSMLSTIASCSTRAVLEYVHCKTTEGEYAAMKAGTAAHAALEVFFKGGTVKESMRAFRKSYKVWAEEHIDPTDRYQARLSYENTSKIMRYWMRRHPVASMVFEIDPRCVEIPFSYPLNADGSVVLRGILDAGPVKHKETGKLYVVDHKTTSSINPFWLGKFKMDSQATGYIWGVQELTPETVVGLYINAIEFSKLPGLDDPTMKCRNPDHSGVTYEECQPLHVKSELFMVLRSEQQKVAWQKSALHLVARFKKLALKYADPKMIDRVPQEGTFHGSCAFCPYKDFCLTGRQHKLMNSMLVDFDPDDRYRERAA